MAELTYHKIGKWIEIDGSTFYTFYGKDFNPNVPNIWWWWTTITASDETTSFNLTWFQPWNEVWCIVLTFDITNDCTLYIEYEFQQYIWWWQTSWAYSDTYYVWAPQTYSYLYFGVDYDEIWDNTNQYRIVVNRECSDGTWENWIINNFTVSNLSIDSGYHNSWYLWIEWNNLCYTDAIFWSMWFKHKINYDTWYNWWSGDPWYIWIPSWTTWRIYYTDAYGTVRRTHLADSRYGWSRYWSPWYIYVSNGWDASDWYWYLCFVDGNGELRRLWNWVP